MKNITMKRLHLENFKCHRLLEICFDGSNASIYGDNATGKTSIYDSLTWLLFGKDSQGNGDKNTEVKPLNAGGEVADHDCITMVEAVLTVDGEDITLRREYHEVWSTKRGSSVPTYDGNASEYYIDGVPTKLNAFKAATKEIVDEDLFRMLTSVHYFANDLPWQKRREILMQVSGMQEDKVIMGRDPENRFEILMQGLGKLSLDDYKAKLMAKRKGLVGTRNEIPARIDECKKTVEDMSGLDFEGARLELEQLNARKDSLSRQLLEVEHSTAIDQKNMELREAQLELNKLEAENRAHRASQQAGQTDTAAIQKELDGMRDKHRAEMDYHMRLTRNIADYNQSIDTQRQRWMEVNSERFAGAANCPTCGQRMPEDKIRQAKEQFEADRELRLRHIESMADDYKKAKKRAEEEMDGCVQRTRQQEARIHELTELLENAKRLTVTVADMDGYADLKAGITKGIQNVQDELYRLREDSRGAADDIRKQRNEVTNQINDTMALIGKEGTLTYARERMDQLRQDAQEAAEQLARVEQMLFLIDEFTRFKVGFIEESVNEQFRIARFRLFREQANGGLEDRCDVVYQGVPYMGLNSGAKINVGIDILNTLSLYYGVSVPLFIDNAESVTRLENADTQIIRLVVSENDKELRVTHEN